MAELDDLTSAQLYGWLRSRLNRGDGGRGPGPDLPECVE